MLTSRAEDATHIGDTSHSWHSLGCESPLKLNQLNSHLSWRQASLGTLARQQLQGHKCGEPVSDLSVPVGGTSKSCYISQACRQDRSLSLSHW